MTDYGVEEVAEVRSAYSPEGTDLDRLWCLANITSRVSWDYIRAHGKPADPGVWRARRYCAQEWFRLQGWKRTVGSFDPFNVVMESQKKCPPIVAWLTVCDCLVIEAMALSGGGEGAYVSGGVWEHMVESGHLTKVGDLRAWALGRGPDPRLAYKSTQLEAGIRWAFSRKEGRGALLNLRSYTLWWNEDKMVTAYMRRLKAYAEGRMTWREGLR